MKILFLNDGYPVSTNIGSIFYLRLLNSYGIKNFCYYSVSEKVKSDLLNELQNIPHAQSSLRIFPPSKIGKYFKKLPIIEELYYFLSIKFTVKRIRKFIHENNVDLVIAIFRSDVLAVVNKILINKIPLIGYISDTIYAENSDKKLIYIYKKNQYNLAISSSKGLFVAGETMLEYFKNLQKRNLSILRMGYAANITKRKISNHLNIFFSGSIYAINEFEAFCDALNAFSRKFKKYTITLYLATRQSFSIYSKEFNIIQLGWQKEQDLLEIMKISHFGYVPYCFDKNKNMQMRYAFPSKVGFYLSTGLPIFFHGPSYSSITEFFKNYPCGIHCSSIRIDQIILQISKLVLDNVGYDKLQDYATLAYNSEFTLQVMKSRFKSMIDDSLNKEK